MQREWKQYMTWVLKRYHIESNGYKRLLSQLHETDYIEEDEARYEDGIRLRRAFLTRIVVEDDRVFNERRCSVLEMMIGFAEKWNWRIGDATIERPFWTFINNLGLLYMTDSCYKQEKETPEMVKFALDRWQKHEFLANGWGGLFPLRNAETPQYELKNWEQMNRYLSESEPPYRKTHFVN